MPNEPSRAAQANRAFYDRQSPGQGRLLATDGVHRARRRAAAPPAERCRLFLGILGELRVRVQYESTDLRPYEITAIVDSDYEEGR